MRIGALDMVTIRTEGALLPKLPKELAIEVKGNGHINLPKKMDMF